MHEEDVVDAISRLLPSAAAGIFNLTADGTMKLSEAAQHRRPEDPRRCPASSTGGIAAAAWKLHLPNVEAPPGQIEFVRYPWIASNEKLKRELGLDAALHEPRDLRDHDARKGHRHRAQTPAAQQPAVPAA